MPGTLRPTNISTRRQQIAQLAQREPKLALTTLAHYIDLTWLMEAHRLTRKDGAPGIDGQTAREYEQDLEGNLRDLEDRAKSGDRYRAPPVRRVYIPKGEGKTRPIGIPTFEDKVLQRAFAMVLEPIYEHDFLDCSYGFRPGRSAHQALEEVREQTRLMGGGWILDVDIKGFFDNLRHDVMRFLLQRRIRDGVVLRMIGKWLQAGVMEDGVWERPTTGTPQGGVISPLLANIYLHYAVDLWFTVRVKPKLRGRAFMVRYADDIVMGFARREDAEQVLAALAVRLEPFGLTLHPDKTRLVEFRAPRGGSGPRPGTFNFLGFTFYWGKSKRGRYVIKWKTAHDRMSRSVRAFNEWCRRHRHDPVHQQQETLNRKLRGHYAYFGLTGNYRRLLAVFRAVTRLWRKWLDRRDQRGRMPWARFTELLARHPLATPRVVHSIYRRT